MDRILQRGLDHLSGPAQRNRKRRATIPGGCQPCWKCGQDGLDYDLIHGRIGVAERFRSCIDLERLASSVALQSVPANVPTEQTFVIQITDPNGPGYINYANIFINNTYGGAYPCQMNFSVPYNQLYFFVTNSAGVSVNVGTGSPISATHCTLIPAHSSVTYTQNGVTLSLALSLQPSAVGPQNLYVSVYDANGVSNANSINSLATWTAYPEITTLPPSVSVTQPGITPSQTLHYQFSDGNGFTYLDSMKGTLTQDITLANSPCSFIFYLPNWLYLNQIVNGIQTQIGYGSLGGGSSSSGTGILGAGGPCAIDLNNSKVHINPNASLPDPDPNSGLYTTVYLDLATAVTALPENIYLSALDMASRSVSNISAGTWASIVIPPPSLSPTSQTFQGGGGFASVTVTEPAGVAWTAASNAAWITFPAGNMGSGTGPLQYQIAANNTGSPLTGTITVTTAGGTATVAIIENALVSGTSPGVALQSVPANVPTEQTFVIQITDPNGPGYIDHAYIFINNTYGGAYPCQMGFFVPANQLYFFVPNSPGVPVNLGTGSPVSTTHCTLIPAHSSVTIPRTA
jgi:hypothetical protein